jgi:hypothetical protein
LNVSALGAFCCQAAVTRWKESDTARTFSNRIAVGMWWTSLAIAVVASYFEWSYRKRKRKPEEVVEEQPPVALKAVPEKVSLLQQAGSTQKEAS